MSFVQELRRRNVFKVAVLYVVAAWLILQVADVLFPNLGAPDWAFGLVLGLLILFFFPVLIFSWVFELTPEGLKREAEVSRSQSITDETGRKINILIVVMLALAICVIVVDRLVPDAPQGIEGAAREAQARLEATNDEATLVAEPSIAVLAFTNMSDDPANEYFSDGISEEILNLLAKLPGLHVTSRSSAFQFKGHDIDIPTVAKQLGVAHILEGSVRKSGNQVRITAQLIDADEDRHMWSESYDRELDDLFAVQDEIAAAVVAELQQTLLGTIRTTDLAQSNRTDPRAYDLYLRARHELWKRRPVALAEAESLFEEAIEIDPNYAPAYAGLATTMVFQTGYTSVDVLKAQSRAETAISRALELDPDSAEALSAKGLLRGDQGRTAEARSAFERAIALNPNASRPYAWLSNDLSTADPERALNLAEKAYSTDPLVRITNLALANRLTQFDRHDEVMRLAREFETMYPDSGWAYKIAASVHSVQGRWDLWLMGMYRAFRTDPEQTFGFDEIPFVVLNLGEPDLADAWLDTLSSLAPQDVWTVVQQSMRAENVGQHQLAMEILANAAERNDDPRLDDELAFVYMIGGDFRQARQVLERARPYLADDPPTFDIDHWPTMINYAMALQRTGGQARARGLLEQARAVVESQIDVGVVSSFWGPMRGWLAALDALQGKTGAALGNLRTLEQRGVLCDFCLRQDPYWDSIRSDAEFIQIVSDVQRKLADQRQALADERMLLTPEQLVRLPTFEFDPITK